MFTCRPNRSGVSSQAGAGSTKRCFGVQSDNQKNACDRTRVRTVINPLSAARVINPKIAAYAVPDEGTYPNPEKPGKAYLTIKPLSEMSNRGELDSLRTYSGLFHFLAVSH